MALLSFGSVVHEPIQPISWATDAPVLEGCVRHRTGDQELGSSYVFCRRSSFFLFRESLPLQPLWIVSQGKERHDARSRYPSERSRVEGEVYLRPDLFGRRCRVVGHSGVEPKW